MTKKNIKGTPEGQQQFLSRIASGNELLSIANSSNGYKTYYEETDITNDSECVNEIIQNLTDYGDICGMIEACDKVKMGVELNEFIKDVEERGYWLFKEKKVGKKHKPVVTIIIRKKIDDQQSPYKS